MKNDAFPHRESRILTFAPVSRRWGRTRMTLRQAITNLMVNVHQISPELASYHVVNMDAAELHRRLHVHTPGGNGEMLSVQFQAEGGDVKEASGMRSESRIPGYGFTTPIRG